MIHQSGRDLARRREGLADPLDAPLRVGEGAVLLREGRGGEEDVGALRRLVHEEVLDDEAVELAERLLRVVEIGLGEQRVLAHHVHRADPPVEAALDHLGDHEPGRGGRAAPPDALEARRGCSVE